MSRRLDYKMTTALRQLLESRRRRSRRVLVLPERVRVTGKHKVPNCIQGRGFLELVLQLLVVD